MGSNPTVGFFAIRPAALLPYLSPALADAPDLTHTASGIPGDPLNLALVGTEADLHLAMIAAKWFPADKITLASSLRIAVGAVFDRPYADSPVSSLHLWGRKGDLAFEQPVGGDPQRRHHVRFWRSEKQDEPGRPRWMGGGHTDTTHPRFVRDFIASLILQQGPQYVHPNRLATARQSEARTNQASARRHLAVRSVMGIPRPGSWFRNDCSLGTHLVRIGPVVTMRREDLQDKLYCCLAAPVAGFREEHRPGQRARYELRRL